MLDRIQWATLATHHFFRAHIVWQKCWNRTFSMIIYLLTIYLFDDIKKTNIESTHAIRSASSKKILTKMHVQPERLYFLFEFCARHYPWWSLWQKNTKNNYFIQIKTLFRSLNLVTPLRFEEMLVFTSYIHQYNNQTGFPSQIVLLWVTWWHRNIKTLKHIFIDMSYSFGSSWRHH